MNKYCLLLVLSSRYVLKWIKLLVIQLKYFGASFYVTRFLPMQCPTSRENHSNECFISAAFISRTGVNAFPLRYIHAMIHSSPMVEEFSPHPLSWAIVRLVCFAIVLLLLLHFKCSSTKSTYLNDKMWSFSILLHGIRASGFIFVWAHSALWTVLASLGEWKIICSDTM